MAGQPPGGGGCRWASKPGERDPDGLAPSEWRAGLSSWIRTGTTKGGCCVGVRGREAASSPRGPAKRCDMGAARGASSGRRCQCCCWAHLAAEHVPRSHQEQRARHAQGTQRMPCEATLLPTFAIPALLYHNAQCAHMDSGEKKTAMPLNGRLCTCSARLECWRLWKARRGSR